MVGTYWWGISIVCESCGGLWEGVGCMHRGLGVAGYGISDIELCGIA